MTELRPMAFVDLQAQRGRLGSRIDQAIARVLEHGIFIMGPEVRTLEGQLTEYCGAAHAVGCANGTDALVMALMARGVGPGDAVYVPSFTFASTAEAVALVGATPVFVDVDDTFDMDPSSLAAAVDATEDRRPVAVIPVDLFGHLADYEAIGKVADAHGLWVLADAAQSFGASRDGRRAGSFGDIATTSFFPAKPLGCYGDGGAIFTDDDQTADVLRSIRVHGKGSDKYDNVRIGTNGRLDTLQAAILIEKLAILPDEIEARQRVAERYSEHLADVVQIPSTVAGVMSAWAQYTVRVDNRDAVAGHLKTLGVPTAVYYPKPLHRQTAYRDYPVAPGGLPVSDAHAQRVLSLPMHPYLDEASQDRVVSALREAVRSARP